MNNLPNIVDFIYKSIPLSEVYKNPLFLVDIFIVVLLFWAVYKVFKNTRAERIFYGFLFLGIMVFLSSFFNLVLTSWLLSIVFVVLLVAIPVVFQPELRSALEKLGRTGIKNVSIKQKLTIKYIDVIKDTLSFLSKNKIGAIIAIEGKTGLGDYVGTGTIVDAEISKDLLISCMVEESPLHDGAVIISKGRLVAASCILPLSENDSALTLGTRHRAALGLSEHSDAMVLVVSEKSGEISFAFNGNFAKNISATDAKEILLKKINKSKFDKEDIIRFIRK